MTDLNEFAPYPQSEAEATAGALARHEAVHAFMLVREAADMAHRMFAASLETRGPTIDEVTQYTATAREARSRFLVTLLLRAVAEHAPDAADEVAGAVWRAQQGTEDTRDFLWHWLRDAGIDPERVVEAQRAGREAA